MKPSKKTKLLNKYRRAMQFVEKLLSELEEQKFPDICLTVRAVTDARFLLSSFPMMLERDIPERDKNATFRLEEVRCAE